MANELKKIDDLMKQKRWDEAERLLKQLFTSEILHDKVRGEAFIAYTMAYLEALTKINLEYKTALEAAVMLIKKIKQIETEVKEDIDLERVNAEINQLAALSKSEG